VRRIQSKRIAVGAVVLAASTFAGGARGEQFFASNIVSRTLGSPSQSAFQNTTLTLGGPRGGGPTQQGLHVLNLGVGGNLTLGFDSVTAPRAIADAPGADFLVFENSFYADGEPTAAMAELMFVEVSSNGADFARFPVESATAAAVGPFGTINPADVVGFAGVHPVLANVASNAIDPFDPAAAGGDAFDLASLATHPLVTAGTLDLANVRFVRLVDVLGDGTLSDRLGRPIYDAIDTPTETGNGGADVDAVAVIHGVPEPSTGVVAFTTVVIACLRRRRHRR
jgi:hypothetical protein